MTAGLGQLFLQRFGHELPQRLTAFGGRGLGASKQRIRNLERGFHGIPILPYLWGHPRHSSADLKVRPTKGPPYDWTASALLWCPA